MPTKEALSYVISEHHKNAYISRDMSFKERETAKVLRMELKKHRSQGEQNIVIRQARLLQSGKTLPLLHQTID